MYKIIFKKEIAIGILVLIVSFLVYFRNYQNPSNLFWDENYFIASAYKYINGSFFMEPHPPLGKLLIAAGELIFRPNIKLDMASFINTDYIKDIPTGFSFIGVRFFPVLAATLSAGLFYFILLLILKNPVLAGLFSGLYLFDNALIVHSRGAMLDSIQIFFFLGTLTWFFYLIESKKYTLRYYSILGLLIGLSLTVKLNSWVLLLLIPISFYFENKQKKIKLIDLISVVIDRTFIVIISILIIFVGTYYLHIRLANKVVNQNYYQATEEYKKVLDQKKTANLTNAPLMIWDQLLFIPHYEKGVPVYDVCKDGENGSQPWTWPFGNKTINYRWEKSGDKVQYLYLQSNPLIWGAGILSIILIAVLLLSKVIFGLKIKDKRLFQILMIILSLYCAYMISILTLKRVMYLYHYFIPLILSLISVPILLSYLFDSSKIKSKRLIYISIFILITLVFISFIFFSPFTYYQPLTSVQFQLRNWFPWWHLKPIQ